VAKEKERKIPFIPSLFGVTLLSKQVPISCNASENSAFMHQLISAIEPSTELVTATSKTIPATEKPYIFLHFSNANKVSLHDVSAMKIVKGLWLYALMHASVQ
jgi:hypothetical protein